MITLILILFVYFPAFLFYCFAAAVAIAYFKRIKILKKNSEVQDYENED